MKPLVVYLAGPANAAQCTAASGLPVLLSYAVWLRARSVINQHLPTFSSVLLDSGAYSELNSKVKIDLAAYVEWAQSIEWATAWAGLDDISGDWRRSLRNYRSGGFPTFHDTDPPELLDDLIEMARERGKWIGLGVKPPRTKKAEWVSETLKRIPKGFHVHGWALTSYVYFTRLNSVDSTHWWREAMKYRTWFPWLTYNECLAIAVKKIERFTRMRRLPTVEALKRRWGAKK